MMPTMSMIEAIRDAHAVAMERDDRVVVFGEDVGYFGGVFRCVSRLWFATVRTFRLYWLGCDGILDRGR